MRSVTLRAVLLLTAGLSLACAIGKDVEVEGDEAGECSDEADNDVNGLFDCDDPGCEGSPACDTPSDNSGSTDDTGTSSVDDTGEQPQDTGNPHEGTYVGFVGWELPELSYLMCEGEIELTVEEGGALYGDAPCPGVFFGQEFEYRFSLDGRVAEDGGVTGTATYDVINAYSQGFSVEPIESPVTGQVRGGQLEAVFEATVDVGSETDLVGWVSGER